jgi:hypothetical protein
LGLFCIFGNAKTYLVMKKPAKKTEPAASQPERINAHPELGEFYVRINSFGEIERSHTIEQINLFLNKKVVDQKLKDRFGYKSGPDDDTVEFMYGDK